MTSITELLPSNTSSSNLAVQNNDQLGQEEFLELMVAQLSNQDPTNPTDSSQFFSQIAEFSVVEGVNEMSKNLNEFTSLYASSQAFNAINLVGRDVMTNSNMAYFEQGQTVSASMNLTNSASSAVVYVQDDYGNIIKEIELGSTPQGEQQFEWDGKNEDGGDAVTGNYWLNAYAEVNGVSQSVPVFAHGKVDSILIDSTTSEYQLTLRGGSKLDATEVTRIFQ